MNEKEIEKYRRQVTSQAPVIAGWLRRRALNKLRLKAEEGDGEAREELCRLVIEQAHSEALKIAVAAGYARIAGESF